MNKLTAQAPQSFRGRMFKQDSARPKEQRILVLQTGIAGLKYHIENDAEKKALRSIKPGTELMLFREPDNEYDQWAIAVHLTKEDKLGFISRFKNETIARMMDAGKKFIGIVDDPEVDPAAKKIVEKAIEKEKEKQRSRHAPTENMALPFSVYLIEEM